MYRATAFFAIFISVSAFGQVAPSPDIDLPSTEITKTSESPTIAGRALDGFKILVKDHALLWSSPFRSPDATLKTFLPLASFTAGALLADHRINSSLPNSNDQIRLSKDISRAGTYYSLGAVAGGFIAAGGVFRNRRAIETGLLVGEAVAHSESISQMLKYATGRERPDFTTRRRSQTSTPRRKMTSYDLDKLLQLAPRRAGGRYRAMASLWIEGEVLGPWQYSDTRPDDPNDIYPHQNRRDLRGLYVFGAWLNHYDATALNTLDSIVEEHGVRFVRHYLIDFGSMLGSSARGARNPRNEYVYHYDLDFAWKEALSFGLFVPKWQRASYAHLPEAGRFEGDAFDPLNWKPIYPNPAFVNRRPDDIYWAAKQVAAFSNEEIRKLIEAGQYNDDRTVDYMTSVLIQRRDKIARAAFSMVLPLDNFAVMNGEVVFDDLAVKFEFRDPLDLSEDWFTYNPATGNGQRLAQHGLRLPPEAETAKTGSVIGLTLRARQQPLLSVDVFLRRTSEGAWDVVGIRRNW